MISRRIAALTVTLLVFLALPASAHVGSPDVFLDAQAGPYHLFVTVRPPRVIPGVADVEVRANTDEVREMRIVPLPLTGAGALFAPVSDQATRSSDDRRMFTGHLWMMTAGAWQVRVEVNGDRGKGAVSVPVPTLPQATLGMSRALGVALFALMLLLCAGLVAIVGAATREAGLEPGEAPSARARVRGRIAMGLTSIAMIIVVGLGNVWWTNEADRYARYVYKPLQVTPRVITDTDGGRSVEGRELQLTLTDPGWLRSRRLDDLVADHGHLMHLFVVSPALDRLWHLHPRQIDVGVFTQPLPDFVAGGYELFADVVHATGVSETATAEFVAKSSQRGAKASPSGSAKASAERLDSDDSEWAESGQRISNGGTTIELKDGGRIMWLRENELLVTKRLSLFTFRVERADGRPAEDLELYMGMPAHAVFVRRDRRVFAHIHPSGSAPMAAVDLAARSLAAGRPSNDVTHASAMHMSHNAGVPATISFPYGVPEPGEYRIFVQVKRAGRIHTAAFDARVGR